MRTRGKKRADKKWERLLSDPSGSSLLLVICIMMMIAALSLSILLATGSLLSVAGRISSGEQCQIMADSVGRVLEEELADRPYEEAPTGIRRGDSLWAYVGAHVCSRDQRWMDYDPDGGPDHALSAVRRSFQIEDDSWPEEAGRIQIDLYWEKGSREQWDGSEDWERYFCRMDIDLHVEITCTCQNSSCTIRQIYSKVSSEGQDGWKWSRIVEKE